MRRSPQHAAYCYAGSVVCVSVCLSTLSCNVQVVFAASGRCQHRAEVKVVAI